MEEKADVATFSGIMDVDVVMDWLEALENLFECEGAFGGQMVKIAKSKLRGATLT